MKSSRTSIIFSRVPKLGSPLPIISRLLLLTALLAWCLCTAQGQVTEERLILPGWDPADPVPALAWHPHHTGKLPLLIYMHGLNGSKTENRQRLRELAGRGVFVVAIDAYLHGERRVPGLACSGGGGLGTDASIWLHQESIAHTVRDVQAGLGALLGRPDIDASRAAFAGASMGGSAALVLACREPRLKAFASVIGAVNFWWDVLKTPPGPEQDARKAQLSPSVRRLVDSIDPLQRCRKFDPGTALLFVNGEADRYIDIRSVDAYAEQLRQQFADAPDNFRFIKVPAAGHQMTEGMWKEVEGWLLAQLLSPPARKTDAPK